MSSMLDNDGGTACLVGDKNKLRIASSVQFVVKSTKFCNLRCSYCYEFAHLDDRQRLSSFHLRKIFEGIKTSRLFDKCEIEYIWHGGEPLLLGVDFYKEVHRIQRDVFGGAKITNSCQTNGTAFSPAMLDYIQYGGFFDEIGISLDPLSRSRIDKSGNNSFDRVNSAVTVLRDRGIEFGAITVLTREALNHVQEIYRFFDQNHLNVRFLPFYMADNQFQIDRHAISAKEISDAYWQIFCAWLQSEEATDVAPIHDYIECALRVIENKPLSWQYDRKRHENIFIIDLDGELYGVGSYGDVSYGNIFSLGFDEIFNSPTRAKAAEDGMKVQESWCVQCKYNRYCSGYHAAHTSTIALMHSENQCVIRTFLDRAIPVIQISLT